MTDFEAHKLPPAHCLDCGKRLDRASSPGAGRGPQPGDITICLDCGHIMAFADDLSFRQLTDAEIVEVAGDPDVIKTQRLIAFACNHAARKPK